MKKGVDYIGVNCIFFCHDGKGNILMHKRSQACRDEQGCWDCGAGSMKFGETFEDTIRREVKEEYGCEPLKIEYVGSRNVLRDGGKSHWVANLHYVLVDPTQVINGEPDKIEEIGWYPIDAFPEPMHSQLHHDIEMIKEYLARV